METASGQLKTKRNSKHNPKHKRFTQWALIRQDDNNNRFLIQRYHQHQEAIKALAHFEKGKHKQLYWLEKLELETRDL